MLFCGSGAAAPAANAVGDSELAVATVRYGDSNAIGSKIEGSALSGLFTRVEIGHIGIRSAGKDRISSPKCRRCRTERQSTPDRRLFESRNRARRSDRANNGVL